MDGWMDVDTNTRKNKTNVYRPFHEHCYCYARQLNNNLCVIHWCNALHFELYVVHDVEISAVIQSKKKGEIQKLTTRLRSQSSQYLNNSYLIKRCWSIPLQLLKQLMFAWIHTDNPAGLCSWIAWIWKRISK